MKENREGKEGAAEGVEILRLRWERLPPCDTIQRQAGGTIYGVAQ